MSLAKATSCTAILSSMASAASLARATRREKSDGEPPGLEGGPCSSSELAAACTLSSADGGSGSTRAESFPSTSPKRHSSSSAARIRSSGTKLGAGVGECEGVEPAAGGGSPCTSRAMKGGRLLSRFPAVCTPEMFPSLATALKRQPRMSRGRKTFSPAASRQRRNLSPALLAAVSPTRMRVSPLAISLDRSFSESTSSEREANARSSCKMRSGKKQLGVSRNLKDDSGEIIILE